MSVPPAVTELMQRFEQHRNSYVQSQYKEAQLRADFIDPFFEALGWDVRNQQGYAEKFREVVYEPALKVAQTTEAPDYSFRIGGVRQFFVEVKKPAVSIGDSAHPAYQLRRYAWSAKLPLSVLTDFEELAAYDCRVKPAKTDKASTARVLFINYREYADRWDELAGIFSRQAVLTGSFDRYAESSRAKRGTTGVDAAFLQEIERWRELLARNLALRNRALSQRELNFAVQRTIDRIIFLRIAEDRGIESYGALMALQNGGQVYERLFHLFRQADDRYDSGLFYFRPEKGRSEDDLDALTPNLAVDDAVLKGIFKNLYYPDSPYEFSVLPLDILGQVYEQFLGKVIRLTPAHQAKVEEKPEVRKAGGVYYTPTYIVDYIVQNTVGKLVEGKTPQAISRLRILDPACGSGSFLLGAYQYLLDWHLRVYSEAPRKWSSGSQPRLYQARHGEWRLTTGERKRILLNNLYGVDIDAQAVEVTKLSLSLKVLEGENEQTLTSQLMMFHERALPDLGRNIKCGNSLIGPDFYPGRQMSLLDEEEAYRVNAFDWPAEFPEIMQAGGFDAVIGNPPYIRIQTMKEWAPLEVEFYKQRYQAAGKGNYDIYVVFVEKGLSLLNPHGRLGFILPHKFFNSRYGAPLRSLLAEGNHLAQVVHFGDQQVFANATTYTCLIFLDKAANSQCQFVKVDDLAAWRSGGGATEGAIPAASITDKEWNFVVGGGTKVFEKVMDSAVKLGDIAHIFVGLQTSADTVYLFKDIRVSADLHTTVHSKELGRDFEIETDLLKPVVRSGSIDRYRADATAAVLFPYELCTGKMALIPRSTMERTYPLAWAYFTANKRLLESREHGKFGGDGWYQLYPKNLDLWEQPKVLVPYMITRLSAYYDTDGLYFVNVTTGGFGVTIDERHGDPRYFTGLLNSRLLDWVMKRVSTNFHNGYLAANKQFLVQLPISPYNSNDPADRARHDGMVALVERMLDLHRQLPAAQTPQAKTMLKRQIEATDREIDRLVYELYDLSEDEIRILEGR
jgi:hypothetical protein